MAMSYWINFSPNDPRTYTGLSPTFLIFSANGLTALTPPGITELPISSGFYRFSYTPSLPIVFLVDGGATLSTSLRYVQGSVDSTDVIDQAVALGITAIASGITGLASGVTGIQVGVSLIGGGLTLLAGGLTNLQIGVSLIGGPSDSFGTTAIDPGTIFGSVKRIQELLEGNSIYAKSTGIWDMYSRGSSTLLREKTLVNNTTQASKS